jgi:hypothetical protein
MGEVVEFEIFEECRHARNLSRHWERICRAKHKLPPPAWLPGPRTPEVGDPGTIDLMDYPTGKRHDDQ